MINFWCLYVNRTILQQFQAIEYLYYLLNSEIQDTVVSYITNHVLMAQIWARVPWYKMTVQGPSLNYARCSSCKGYIWHVHQRTSVVSKPLIHKGDAFIDHSYRGNLSHHMSLDAITAKWHILFLKLSSLHLMAYGQEDLLFVNNFT